MKKRYLLLFVCSYILLFSASIFTYNIKLSHPTASDSGQLLPVAVKSIYPAKGEQELKMIIKKANINEDTLSIAGMQHSQGGHTMYPNGILIDMKSFNKILKFDLQKKLITVQSGATWEDIQEYINPYGLSLKVGQSQNIFTVGGSISVIGHGRDIRNGSLTDTVISLRLLTPEGEVIEVSRTENEELFPYVIGGYGLFGVIVDVTLQLTEDELYVHNNEQLNYQEYATYFKNEVLGNESVKMHVGRISVAPETFLSEMYITNYTLAPNQADLDQYNTLKGEPIIAIPKFFLGLARYSEWGKNIFWDIQKQYNEKTDQKLESRNNVMRSDSEFMEYNSVSKTEILQEYFVPIDNFEPYIDSLKRLLEDEKDFNLLNITIRYVGKDDQVVMNYATDDMFSLVLLINQGTTKKDIEETGQIVRKMIDLTLAHDGTYYLPYYPYATKEQLYAAYPQVEDFFLKKKIFDSNERFSNMFYKEYSQ
ncbi:FAD-binding oxidoreductase [Pseudogracilibacillus sp. SE30717A]|uniref:FAD-binding oxidoreductase n=1 Tax=Pseudogracilibacillus sp. SE30717A TaxID=3098293 RepID=UPI00300E0588